MYKKIKKKLYVVAPLINSLFTLFTFPLLINKLSLEEFGQYSLVLLIISIAIVIFGFSFNQVINSYFKVWSINQKEENEFSKIICLQFLLNFILVFIIFIVFNFFEMDKTILIFAIIITVSSSILQSLLAYLRMKEFVKLFIIFTCIPVIFNSLIKIYYLFFNNNVNIESLLFIDMISSLLVYIYIFKTLNLKIIVDVLNKKYVINILKFSFPLIYNSLTRRLVYSYDKILINFMLDYKSLGLYMIAFKLYNYVHLILSAYKNYWVPFLIKNYEKTDEVLTENNQVIIIFSLLNIVVMILAFPFISYFNNGEFNYSDVMILLPILMINILLQIVFFGYGTIPLISKNTKSLYTINTFTIISSIIYGPFLVYSLELYGAILMLILNNIMTLYLYYKKYDTKLIKFNYWLISLFILLYSLIGGYFEYIHNS